MKRAILILAAALIGTTGGCTTRRCDPGTLTLYWTFTDAAGVTRGCAGSGVSNVRITIDRVVQLDQSGSALFACQPFADGVEGIQLTDFVTATHDVQVEGLDANQQQLYLAQTSVRTNGCGDTTVPLVLPAVQGTLQVSYSISPVNTCPTASFVWYSITDLTTNTVFSTVDALNTPRFFVCGDLIVFDAVPFGPYRLDFIQTVVSTGNPSSPWLAVDGNCTPQTVNHLGNDAITVTLYEIGQPGDPSNCPL